MTRDAESSTAVDELAEELVAGERRALAQAITLAESARPDHQQQAATLLDAVLAHTGSATRIGVSGAPGTGKSTFIEVLGVQLTDAGHRVAVLAVDPSSSVSGGSILGDKTRMEELSRREAAFIRPSPSGGTLGGVARRTREAMLLCEAAGFDVVLIETVGVGQSETAVADLVDLFLVLVAPGGGDELQGIKRGIMELADVVVVNKADRDLEAAAGRVAGDYANALHLMRPKWRTAHTRVLLCSALEERGVDEVWTEIEGFRDEISAAGELAELRRRQAVSWMWSEVEETALDQLRNDPSVGDVVAAVESRVADGDLSPATAAHQILEAFRG